MNIKPPRAYHGFTLVELMVTVAILAILAMIAAPQMQNQITASRVTSATNELIAELTRARSDAVKLNQQVSINPTTIIANRGNANVSIVSNPAGLAASITFNADGTTANAGTITISNSSRSRDIRVLGSGKSFVTN